ncbi:MAG: Dabb family protein, partial [bacterium]|nr:Dabb family protein [bacterium]
MMKRFGLLVMLAAVCLSGCGQGAGKFRHVVLFKFKDEAPKTDVKVIEDEIVAFPSTMPMIRALEWGKDCSVEKLAKGFTHCYFITFDNAGGLKAYLPHPTHQTLVKKLKPAVEK